MVLLNKQTTKGEVRFRDLIAKCHFVGLLGNYLGTAFRHSEVSQDARMKVYRLPDVQLASQDKRVWVINLKPLHPRLGVCGIFLLQKKLF